MLIAIPYVPLRTNFQELAEALVKVGGLKNHVLFLTHTAPDADGARSFYESVKDLFGKAFLTSIPASVAPNSGFQQANAHFSTAAKWASSYVSGPGEINDPPFFYLDPSYHPTKAEWADEISAAYYKNPGNTFGIAEVGKDTKVAIPGGEHVIPGGIVFQGPIVLNKSFAKNSGLIDFLHPEELWRISLRFELASSYSDATEFFAGYFDKVEGVTPKVKAPKVEKPAEPATEEPELAVAGASDGFEDVSIFASRKRKNR